MTRDELASKIVDYLSGWLPDWPVSYTEVQKSRVMLEMRTVRERLQRQAKSILEILDDAGVLRLEDES